MNNQLYNEILSQLQAFYGLTHKGKKAGRKPKVSIPQIAALYILSYVMNAPVLTLAKHFISPSIKPYHIFRRDKTRQVYD